MRQAQNNVIMIEYSLSENLLTERKDDYVAVTHVKNSYNKVQFIDLILQRGTLVTKTDLVAAFNIIEETAVYVVKNDGELNLPLINTSHSISGVFDSILDIFDPNRHKVHINLHKGTLLRDAEKEVKLAKVNTPAPQPFILEVKDSVSGKVDEVLTSGGAIEISGINIKITGDKPEVGLYFVNESGIEIKAVTLIQNKPSSVLALIPILAAGNYRVKIVTQYSGGRDLKEPKTTVYGKTFQVW
jgi:hypothetical protein